VVKVVAVSAMIVWLSPIAGPLVYVNTCPTNAAVNAALLSSNTVAVVPAVVVPVVMDDVGVTRYAS
jgi:hypothetical protein